MTFKILQIKDILNCAYAFSSYDFAKKHGFNLQDYECVWEATADSAISLDNLFRDFNRVTDEDCQRLNAIGYKGRSVSTSDIIILDDTAYYCDAFGWAELK